MNLKTYKVQLDSAYNDFRIVEAICASQAAQLAKEHSGKEAKTVEIRR